MKTKKHQPDWYIGVTHFLTAGFVIPLLCSIIFGLGIVSVGIENDSLTYIISRSLVFLVGMYWGIMYSASYISKTHTGYNKKNVVTVGVWIHAIFSFLFIGLLLIAFLNDQTILSWLLIQTFVMAFIPYAYYLWSNKYIPSGNDFSNSNTDFAPKAPQQKVLKRGSGFVGKDELVGVVVIVSVLLFFLASVYFDRVLNQDITVASTETDNIFIPVSERENADIDITSTESAKSFSSTEEKTTETNQSSRDVSEVIASIQTSSLESEPENNVFPQDTFPIDFLPYRVEERDDFYRLIRSTDNVAMLAQPKSAYSVNVEKTVESLFGTYISDTYIVSPSGGVSAVLVQVVTDSVVDDDYYHLYIQDQSGYHGDFLLGTGIADTAITISWEGEGNLVVSSEESNYLDGRLSRKKQENIVWREGQWMSGLSF